MLPACVVSQRAFRKILWRATFTCLCCTFPLMSLHHVLCFCIENNWDGRGPGWLACHSSQWVCVHCMRQVSQQYQHAYTYRWDCTDSGGICGLQESGQLCCFWHAVRLPACLPACLPLLTQHAAAGILMSAVYEHCHWNTLRNVISHKAKPMLIVNILKGLLLTLVQGLNELW